MSSVLADTSVVFSRFVKLARDTRPSLLQANVSACLILTILRALSHAMPSHSVTLRQGIIP